MPTRRKVRSDAKLEHLSPPQHEQLIRWLDDENCSYAEAVARIHREFGLTVGRTAVVGYYQRHVAPLHHACDMESAAAFAELPEGVFDTASLRMAKRLAWSALSQPLPHVERAATLLTMVHQANRQAIAERQLELAERRVVVLEKESARRARRESRAARAAQPEPEAHSHQPPPSAPIPSVAHAPAPALAVAHESEPQPGPETRSSEPLHSQALAQKTPQNLPLYSPYFGLNRDLSSTENTLLSDLEIAPSGLAISPAKIIHLHELAEPTAA